MHSLVVRDRTTGDEQRYRLRQERPSLVMEPTFVPRTPDAPEGDGYLMVPISRWTENLGEYVIFDTEDITVGTGLPDRDPVPTRLHSTRTLDGLPMILSDAEEAGTCDQSVHGIVAGFGNEYFTRCSETSPAPHRTVGRRWRPADSSA